MTANVYVDLWMLFQVKSLWRSYRKNITKVWDMIRFILSSTALLKTAFIVNFIKLLLDEVVYFIVICIYLYIFMCICVYIQIFLIHLDPLPISVCPIWAFISPFYFTVLSSDILWALNSNVYKILFYLYTCLSFILFI